MADILNTIFSTRELSILGTAIKVTSFDKILTADGNFTIFAPNNLAFAQLSKVNLHVLTEDIRLLTEILSVHIISGKLGYQDLLNNCPADEYRTILLTLDSSPIVVDLKDGIKFGNSNVLSTDTSACNGIIHLVDRVMMPVQKLTRMGVTAHKSY